MLRDFNYFDRQRDLFPRWLGQFEDFRGLEEDAALQRFNRELERISDEMLQRESVDDSDQLPIVEDAEGNRKLCLRFDCRKFKPEEITVKTMDNKLSIHGKHDESRPGRRVHTEFTREYTLPEGVDPQKLQSHLLKDGVLQIEAPAPPAIKEAPKEYTIPIQHMEHKEEKK